jgi:hypothetical protein
VNGQLNKFSSFFWGYKTGRTCLPYNCHLNEIKCCWPKFLWLRIFALLGVVFRSTWWEFLKLIFYEPLSIYFYKSYYVSPSPPFNRDRLTRTSTYKILIDANAPFTNRPFA